MVVWIPSMISENIMATVCIENHIYPNTMVNVNLQTIFIFFTITMAVAQSWLGGIGKYPPHPSRSGNTPLFPRLRLGTSGSITKPLRNRWVFSNPTSPWLCHCPNAENLESIGQRAAKLPAFKVEGLKKKSADRPRPQSASLPGFDSGRSRIILEVWWLVTLQPFDL